MLRSGIVVLSYCLVVCSFSHAAIDAEDILKLTAQGKEIIFEGINTTRYLLRFSKEQLDNLDDEMMTVQTAVRSLKAQTDSLDVTEFEYTKDFLKNYDETKNNLNIAKRELVSLSSKLVLISRSIETSLEKWQDKYAKVLVKTQMKQLTRAIKDTQKRLNGMDEKLTDFVAAVTVPDIVMNFEGKLYSATKKSKKEYNLWTDLIKNAYEKNNNSGPVTLGMVIQAITECPEYCSGIKKKTAWIDDGRTFIASIPNYESEIEKFKDVLKNAYRKFGMLDQGGENAITLLRAKIKMTDDWLEKAEPIINTINGFTKDDNDKKVILALRDAFQEAIGSFKTEVQNFYDSATTDDSTQS